MIILTNIEYKFAIRNKNVYSTQPYSTLRLDDYPWAQRSPEWTDLQHLENPPKICT